MLSNFNVKRKFYAFLCFLIFSGVVLMGNKQRSLLPTTKKLNLNTIYHYQIKYLSMYSSYVFYVFYVYSGKLINLFHYP